MRYPLFLLIISFFTRLPSLFVPVLDADEAMYANAARGILRGLAMYRDVIDQKPPLIYYLYSLLLAVVNDLRFVHFAAVFFVWGTAVVMYRLVSDLYDKKSGMIAGIAYVLFVAGIGQASNTQIFANFFVSLGVYLFFYAEQSSAKRYLMLFLAAALVGVSSLFRQQMVFTLLPMIAVVMFQCFNKKIRCTVLEFLILAVGVVLPYVPFFLYFQSIDTLNDFMRWAYLYNFKYLQLGSELDLTRTLIKALVIAVVASNLVLWWYALKKVFCFFARRFEPNEKKPLFFAVVWFAVSVYSVTMGHRFYTHYFLQLTPVLVFLAAPGIAAVFFDAKEISRWKKGALVFLFTAPVVGFLVFFGINASLERYDCQKSFVVKTAEAIQQNSKEDDRVFVWGSAIPLYLADRQTATRFVNSAFAFENRDPCYPPKSFDVSELAKTDEFKMLMDDLRNKKPEIVVDTSDSNLHCWANYPIEKFPPLREFVKGNYRLTEDIDGMRIYLLSTR